MSETAVELAGLEAKREALLIGLRWKTNLVHSNAGSQLDAYDRGIASLRMVLADEAGESEAEVSRNPGCCAAHGAVSDSLASFDGEALSEGEPQAGNGTGLEPTVSAAGPSERPSPSLSGSLDDEVAGERNAERALTQRASLASPVRSAATPSIQESIAPERMSLDGSSRSGA